MRRGGIPIIGNGAIPGNKGHIFVPGGSYPPGGIGQSIERDYDFRYVMDPRSLADGDHGFLVPDLLWVAGDGKNPTVAPPSFSLDTTDGTPVPGTTPWQLPNGENVASEVHSGTSSRRTATAFDPGINDDMIILVVGQVGWTATAGYYSLNVATRQAGRGWRAAYRHDTDQIYCFLNADTQVNVVAPVAAVINGLFTVIIVVDRDGNSVAIINDTVGSNFATPAGSLVGSGIGIGGAPLGGGDATSGSAFVAVGVWYGSDYAPYYAADNYARAKNLSHRLTGIYPVQGDRGTYTRTSARAWLDYSGVWRLGTYGLPVSGSAQGLKASPQRVNKAFRNANPQNANALTWTGGVSPTTADDSTALSADDAYVWGPYVYDFDNTTGSTQYIRMSAQVGNTNPHSLQCLIRVVSGSGTVKLGLYDESAGTFVGTAIHDGYDAMTEIDGQVPADTDCTLCLEVPNGINIRWIAQDMEEEPRCFDPIPNWSTVASATMTLEELASTYTAVDEQGSLESEITPDGYSGGDVGTTKIIRNNSTLSTWLFHTTTQYRFNDGSSSVVLPSTIPTDGVAVPLRCRWKSNDFSISSDTQRGDASYDGTVLGTGPVTIAPDKPMRFATLRIYRNGDG